MDFLLAEDGLQRSTDAGSTWRVVQSLDGRAERPVLAISPDFARDGLVLLAAHGQLQRSDDGGATWAPVEMAAGQGVQQVRFSPDFARDRQIFLAVTSGGFPNVTSDQPMNVPSDDHLLSLGVVASSDGGATWTAASEGLAVEGVPYRHVQQLAVSPSFATDGTLLAFAWGPREPGDYMGGTARQLQAALFRSRDRGTTWESVRVLDRTVARTRALLAFSPRFASDGLVLFAENQSIITPSSSGCRILRGTDGGTSWQSVRERGSYESCGALWLLDGASAPLGIALAGGGWLQARDGGLTWEGLSPPDGTLVNSAASTSPTVGAVPALPLFAGATFGGVWAYGADLGDTNGRLPCAADAEAGFGRVWRNEPWARARLGCPLAAEQPVSIRLRQYEHPLGDREEPVRGVWIDDDSTEWYELSQQTWLGRAKAQNPWPAQADATVRGAVQRFAGGTMLFLPYPDGRRMILVLAQPNNSWREFPD
jgi:photosystem II stability/assembly factor-like uncharacterized protein